MAGPTGGTIRIGMSGWTYAPWRGTFYPTGLPHARELAYAATQLPSIEINGTFYGLQRPSTFAKWHDETPPDFVFSVKAPQYITHRRRLREVETPVANFLLSGVLRLNEKLGPILWQFPPNFKFDASLFEAFLERLPHSTKDAAKLVKNCDARMKGRTWDEIDRDRPLRHAVEIRHDSFANETFVRMLRKHGVALVTADTADLAPMLFDLTADFGYLRLHGADELYVSGYTDGALSTWARRIQAVAKGGDMPGGHRIGPAAAKRAKRDVYVYFDNTAKVRSPFDAGRLAARLGRRSESLADPPAPSKTVPAVAWA